MGHVTCQSQVRYISHRLLLHKVVYDLGGGQRVAFSHANAEGVHEGMREKGRGVMGEVKGGMIGGEKEG